jgi:imidazolonepropionase
MSNGLIIKNAAQLVTCSGFAAKRGAAMADLGIIENGALIAEEGVIRAVGPTDRILDGVDLQGDTVLDASGRAVLPGFVDSHTHFPTTVEGKSGYGLDLETEIKQLEAMAALNADHPVDIVPTFLGAHAVPPEYKGRSDDYIDFIIGEVLPAVTRRQLARCCDVFCEEGVFTPAQSRRLLMEARRHGLRLKLHADEIASLGGAELAAELGALSADHLLQATDKGMDAMARAGVVATLLPATAFSLKEPYARAREMIRRGCAVALATDFNPGSSFTFSIPLVAALAAQHLALTPEEIVSALTLNGAAALGLADKVGSLDVGKAADVIVLAYPSYLYISYHLGVNTVEKVIKNGRIVVEN